MLSSRRATKKRLEDIRYSSVKESDVVQPRKRLISAESLSRTRIASNEKIRKLTIAMSNELQSAGLGDDPVRMVLVWMIVVIILPMIENLMGMSLTVVLVTILVSAFGPMMYIRISKERRRQKFEKQLPHAIDIICNSLKAGYTFQYSMNTVASELEDPIAEEFLMAFRETQYGSTLSDALKNMAVRTSSPDIELLDIAVSVQTTVGANMVDILQSISYTLSTKHDLEEEIKVKTASGKITGVILAIMPIVLLLILNVLNPEYIALFFEEEIGKIMLIFSAVWELIGFLIIRKILNVKF